MKAYLLLNFLSIYYYQHHLLSLHVVQSTPQIFPLWTTEQASFTLYEFVLFIYFRHQ